MKNKKKKSPKNKSFVQEIFMFIWERKLWWLTPLLVLLVLTFLLIFLTQGSAVSPFIYAFL